jgi:sulfur carrier protein
VRVVVNGAEREISESSSVSDLVRMLGHPTDGRGVAVAVNGEVVTRTSWPSRAVRDGDRVEVLAAAQGG